MVGRKRTIPEDDNIIMSVRFLETLKQYEYSSVNMHGKGVLNGVKIRTIYILKDTV